MSRCLVIGASRGLGLEFVRQLLKDGHRVIATARDDEALTRLEDSGADSTALDLTSESSMRDLVDALQEEELDLIIHNAGVFRQRGGTKKAPSKATFHEMMETNVLAPMTLIAGLAPALAARGGRYVFLSSDMASLGEVKSSHGALYRSTKAALNMTVRCAALDFPGARFLALSPGWVKTDMGGTEAPLHPEESVRGMMEVINAMTLSSSGTFRDYRGRTPSW